MLTMNRILVPVDFSPASENAARHAAALSRHFHAEMVLLHVHSLLPMTVGAMDGAYLGPDPKELAERAQRELNSFLESELDDLAVRRVQMEGDPARRIVQFAEEEKPGLIVMSTHGYGPFRRFILGSVTAKVLHDTPFPVWTGVHLEQAAGAPLQLGSVLCAVDLSPHSRRTLCWAGQLAAEFGARLGLVHAAAPLEMTGPDGGYFAPEWRNVLVQRAEQDMAKLQEELGSHAEVFVHSGEAPKVVRQAAAEFPADVLVIGRSPTGGLAGRLRTNAYAIIRESPCPVVSV